MSIFLDIVAGMRARFSACDTTYRIVFVRRRPRALKDATYVHFASERGTCVPLSVVLGVVQGATSGISTEMVRDALSGLGWRATDSSVVPLLQALEVRGWITFRDGLAQCT